MDGSEALRKIEMELPDLVILDIMMPKIDGFDVCRRLREWSQIPTIMLSARGDETDKVKCLDLGADDYLTKPFGTRELLARVRAVLRRTEATKTVSTQPLFTSGDLRISFAQRQVTVAGKEVKLTPTEYSLLQEFVLNAGKTLTHSYLLDRVWGPEYRDEREYLHVFVHRLRTKLEPDATNPKYIMTVPGVGYRFRDTA
jgi:two-component system KDP operon response regulator KdpE